MCTYDYLSQKRQLNLLTENGNLIESFSTKSKEYSVFKVSKMYLVYCYDKVKSKISCIKSFDNSASAKCFVRKINRF